MKRNCNEDSHDNNRTAVLPGWCQKGHHEATVCCKAIISTNLMQLILRRRGMVQLALVMRVKDTRAQNISWLSFHCRFWLPCTVRSSGATKKSYVGWKGSLISTRFLLWVCFFQSFILNFKRNLHNNWYTGTLSSRWWVDLHRTESWLSQNRVNTKSIALNKKIIISFILTIIKAFVHALHQQLHKTCMSSMYVWLFVVGFNELTGLDWIGPGHHCKRRTNKLKLTDHLYIAPILISFVLLSQTKTSHPYTEADDKRKGKN